MSQENHVIRINQYDQSLTSSEPRKFTLTPLQVLLINKMMPTGFKLESNDFVAHLSDIGAKGAPKRHKPKRDTYKEDDDDSPKRKRPKKNEFLDMVSKENSSISNANLKRSSREKKPTYIEDLGYVEKAQSKNAKNPYLIEIYKKCEKALQKLKKHPLADFFSTSQHSDIPSLSLVEKNLKAYNYNSIYQFATDVRKIWSYYYTNFSQNVDVYNRTYNIANAFEEIFKELESQNEEKSQFQELSKQVEKLTKEMNQVKGSSLPPRKMPEKSTSSLDKPMTIQEKNVLGNNIRMLNPDQLKESNSKYFEFDIETLPSRKLRELDKYVKNCLKTKANTQTVVKTNVEKPKTSSSLSENDKIHRLKNMATAIAENNNNSRPAPEYKPPVAEKKEEKNIKAVLSDSGSLSSSDESESLSSFNFNKKA